MALLLTYSARHELVRVRTESAMNGRTDRCSLLYSGQYENEQVVDEKTKSRRDFFLTVTKK